jgi:hypothetical protein
MEKLLFFNEQSIPTGDISNFVDKLAPALLIKY